MKKKTKPTVILGKPLIPNAGVRIWYGKELSELVEKMDEHTRREVLEILKQADEKGGSIESKERIALNKLRKYYEDLFKSKAKELAQSMAKKQDRSVDKALRASVASFVTEGVITAFKPYKLTGKALETFKAAVQGNINLIRSLQGQYFTDIEGAVYRAILDGQGRTELREALMKYGAKSKKRARLIARDQSHKAYEALARIRMEEMGVQYWQWEHGGGTKTVRHYHILDVKKGGLNHSVHKMGEGAYDPTKEIQRDILPGELPYCTCRMRPVIKFD